MTGKLRMITGNMFSGKSTTLIKEIEKFANVKANYEIVKPIIDNRYSPTHVVTHDGKDVRATIIVNQNRPVDILPHIKKGTDIVFIDEINFYSVKTEESPFSMIQVIDILLKNNIHVTCSGLLYDFRHEYFPLSKFLLDNADKTVELFAKCSVCNGQADRTQRLVDGQPAKYTDEIILVGSTDSYEPRCKKHHIVLK